jgi:hypothetical protein
MATRSQKKLPIKKFEKMGWATFKETGTIGCETESRQGIGWQLFKEFFEENELDYI